MLVLSRKRDQQILLGDDVVITVVEIRGDKVRLGIDAPNAVPVHRREVYDAIQRGQQPRTRGLAERSQRQREQEKAKGTKEGGRAS